MRSPTLASLAAAACLAIVAAPARAADIAWAKSFQAAVDQSRASQKLVMADFYTDW